MFYSTHAEEASVLADGTDFCRVSPKKFMFKTTLHSETNWVYRVGSISPLCEDARTTEMVRLTTEILHSSRADSLF